MSVCAQLSLALICRRTHKIGLCTLLHTINVHLETPETEQCNWLLYRTFGHPPIRSAILKWECSAWSISEIQQYLDQMDQVASLMFHPYNAGTLFRPPESLQSLTPCWKSVRFLSINVANGPYLPLFLGALSNLHEARLDCLRIEELTNNEAELGTRGGQTLECRELVLWRCWSESMEERGHTSVLGLIQPVGSLPETIHLEAFFGMFGMSLTSLCLIESFLDEENLSIIVALLGHRLVKLELTHSTICDNQFTSFIPDWDPAILSRFVKLQHLRFLTYGPLPVGRDLPASLVTFATKWLLGQFLGKDYFLDIVRSSSRYPAKLVLEYKEELQYRWWDYLSDHKMVEKQLRKEYLRVKELEAHCQREGIRTEPASLVETWERVHKRAMDDRLFRSVVSAEQWGIKTIQ